MKKQYMVLLTVSHDTKSPAYFVCVYIALLNGAILHFAFMCCCPR